MAGDFKVGDWLVSPALNQISGAGRSVRVEPKAMQVLGSRVGYFAELAAPDDDLRQVMKRSASSRRRRCAVSQ